MNDTGCYLCKHLEWYEAGYEEFCESGYYCENNERSEDFKTFPCVRKLKCFMARDINQEKPNERNERSQ